QVQGEDTKKGKSPRRMERETDRRYGEGGCEGRGMDQREDDQERRVCREAAGEHRGGVIAMECSQVACDTACPVAGGSGALSASSPAERCLSPSKPRRLGWRHSSSSGRPARRHPAASGDTGAPRWTPGDTRPFHLPRGAGVLAMGGVV